MESALARGLGDACNWREVHLAVDGHAQGVLVIEVTTVDWADCEVFERLVEHIEGEITQIDADGAYDTRQVYEVATVRDSRPCRHEKTLCLGKKVIRGMRYWS